MKTISATAIVALMTATLGFAAIAPASAQEAAPVAPAAEAPAPLPPLAGPHEGGPRGGGMGGLFGFERGSEQVEIALVRLSHAIELTAEQQPLFDAYKTAAIDAAEALETKLETLRPAEPTSGTTPVAPTFSEHLKTRIALETAQLDALKAIEPSATAFFDSLTDEQTATLMAQRPDRDGRPGFGPGGQRPDGQHQGHGGDMGGKGHGQGHGHGGMNGQPAPADAPAAPPADAPAPADAAAPADAPAPVNG